MFGLGITEIVLILVLILLLVGPDKLPDAARTVGKAMREIRKAGREIEDVPEVREIRDALRDVQRPIAAVRKPIVDAMREPFAQDKPPPKLEAPAAAPRVDTGSDPEQGN